MEVSQLRMTVEDLTGQLQRSLVKHEELGNLLCELHKELLAASTDPISLQPMQDPVLASDLHTYERESIEEWHRVSPTSPHTRAPMEISTLRRNQVAVWMMDAKSKVAEMFEKYWPEKAAQVALSTDTVLVKDPLPVLIRPELPRALRSGKEDLALELLARPIHDLALNGRYTINGKRISLLHLALIHRLPQAALAVLARKDFRRGQCQSSSGVRPIHLATALGYRDVCRALVADYGPAILRIATQGQVSLDHQSGGTITVPAKVTSLDLARSLKHDSLLEMFHQILERGGV